MGIKSADFFINHAILCAYPRFMKTEERRMKIVLLSMILQATGSHIWFLFHSCFKLDRTSFNQLTLNKTDTYDYPLYV